MLPLTAQIDTVVGHTFPSILSKKEDFLIECVNGISDFDCPNEIPWLSFRK